MEKTVIQVLQELAENICDDFCKYQEEADHV